MGTVLIAEKDDGNRAGRTVLLVEPFERTRDWYKERIEAAEYRVIATASIAEGIAEANHNRPDAVICYLGFPGCSGLAICDELEHLDVPIIFISSGQDEVTKKIFRKEGVMSFDKSHWKEVLSHLQEVAPLADSP